MLSEERLAEIRTTALSLSEARQKTSGGNWRREGDLTVRPETGVDDICKFGDSELGIVPGNKEPVANRNYVVVLQNANVEVMLLDLLEAQVNQKKQIAEMQEQILELQTRSDGEKATGESDNATRSAKKR